MKIKSLGHQKLVRKGQPQELEMEKVPTVCASTLKQVHEMIDEHQEVHKESRNGQAFKFQERSQHSHKHEANTFRHKNLMKNMQKQYQKDIDQVTYNLMSEL